MADSAFLEMRAGLLEQGLLAVHQGDDGRQEYRLTPAGHAHALATIAELRAAPSPEEHAGPRVRWNFNPRKRGRG